MRSLGKTLYLVLVLVFLSSLITLQPANVNATSLTTTTPAPAIEWQQQYGINSVESVSNLIQTSDGGYAFMDLGWSYQFTFTPSSVYKVDSSGNMQWKKTFNFLDASYIIQTRDKGYEISGHWSTYGTTYEYTPTLVKTDSQGDIQWVENYSSVPNLGIASTNIQTSDGGFVHEQFGTIIKTDSNNNTQWVKTMTFQGLSIIPDPLSLSSLIETSDGALAGLGVGNPDGNPRGGTIYLLKIEPFLPLPSQTQLPTPIPTPIMTVSKQILTSVIIIFAITIAIVVSFLFYGRHRKTLIYSQ